MTLPLFSPDDLPDPPSPVQAAQSMGAGKPRLRVPIRDQIVVRWESLDDLLEADHPARVVWAAVCTLDLKSWLNEIKAIERHVGRDATVPRLLVVVWVFATLKGMGSARELARLCAECLPYQWLCGGVSVNDHMLSDFRSQGGEKWDGLLTQIVATLLDAELVKMDRVAQDGMRVRASAGKSSFRRHGRLEELLEAAREQVETLKKLAERPGYNVQFATDTESGVVVGVETTNAGTDFEQLPPMLDQLEERYERVPDEALVDGGFASIDTIERATDRGCTVYAPVKDEEKQRAKGIDPHARKKGDSDATAAWRSRMGTESAKLIYRLRGQTAEWVNAQCRNRGLSHMPVRGQPRCRIIALLFAITHNLLVTERLRSVTAQIAV
jgi:transposase